MAPQYPSFWDSNQQLYHLSTCLKAWNATAALSVTSFAKLINSGLWLSDCGQQLYTGAGRTRGPRHLFPQSTPQQRSSCKKFPKSTTCGHRNQKKRMRLVYSSHFFAGFCNRRGTALLPSISRQLVMYLSSPQAPKGNRCSHLPEKHQVQLKHITH